MLMCLISHDFLETSYSFAEIVVVHISMSRQPRRPKTSYSCAPCKRLKIKCDHNVPCSHCIRRNREDECLRDPAKTLTQFKEMIKPNPLFGRITKTTSNNRERKTSFASSISNGSGESMEQLAVAQEPEVTVPTEPIPPIIHSDSVIELKNHLAQQSVLIEQLQSHNAELKKFTDFYAHRERSRVSITDLYTLSHNSTVRFEKIESLKRTMLDIFPSNSIEWKNRFFTHQARYALIDPPTFEIQLDQFRACLSPNGKIEDINILWMSLLYSVLALASVASSEPYSKQYFERSKQWFIASRQILTFIKDENLHGVIIIQTLLIQMAYCLTTYNLRLYDSLLAQALNEAYALQLHLQFPDDTHSSETELKRIIWWELIAADTLRSFASNRLPALGHHSVLPQSENISEIKARFIRLVNGLRIDSLTNGVRIDRLLTFDKELCSTYEKMPVRYKITETRDHQDLVQLNEIHLFYSILRFKIWQRYLKESTAYSYSVCLILAKNVLSPYKRLRTLDWESYIPSQIATLYCFIDGCIIQLLFLILTSTINECDRVLIINDIDMVINDLTGLCEKLRNVRLKEGLRVIRGLAKLLNESKSVGNPTSSVMNVSSLVHSINENRAPLEEISGIPDSSVIKECHSRLVRFHGSSDKILVEMVLNISELMASDLTNFRLLSYL